MADFRQTLARLSPEERHRLKLYAQAYYGLRAAAAEAEGDGDYDAAAYWRHRSQAMLAAGRELWVRQMEVRNG